MAGELLIQIIDMARFRAIRPALDELDAARTFGLASRAILREAVASPFARRDRRPRFAGLLDRILRHPELELRVFLAPRELDEVIEGVVHVLCFENGAEYSLGSLEGSNWVVIDSAFAGFMDLDWFRAIFLDVTAEVEQLAYPRRRDECYLVLSRDHVARLAAGVQPLLGQPVAVPEVRYSWSIDTQSHLVTNEQEVRQAMTRQAVRDAAEGLARLTAKVLSHKDLTLAFMSLL